MEKEIKKAKFYSPLKVFMTKAKNFILNMNQYRNTHFRLLNHTKINYKKFMERQIIKSDSFGKVICIYTAYPKTNRRQDLGNVCSIHEKYFEDAMVEYGKLGDDDMRNIPLVIYRYGGVDHENPRVDIDVVSIDDDTDKIVDLLKELIEEVIK